MAHALSVRAALASADYKAFFRLYAAAPALGRALMDIYVPKLRFDALTVVVKAFKPSVPVPFLASMLGFVARAAPAAHAASTPAGGSPAAGGGRASPAAAAGGEGAGKSATGAEGESGAAAAGPANGANGAPSDATAAAAAGAAALAEPDGSAAAAAAGGGAADGSAGGGGPREPLPGCMELYFEGDFAGQVSTAADVLGPSSVWSCGAVGQLTCTQDAAAATFRRALCGPRCCAATSPLLRNCAPLTPLPHSSPAANPAPHAGGGS